MSIFKSTKNHSWRIEKELPGHFLHVLYIYIKKIKVFYLDRIAQQGTLWSCIKHIQLYAKRSRKHIDK